MNWYLCGFPHNRPSVLTTIQIPIMESFYKLCCSYYSYRRYQVILLTIQMSSLHILIGAQICSWYQRILLKLHIQILKYELVFVLRYPMIYPVNWLELYLPIERMRIIDRYCMILRLQLKVRRIIQLLLSLLSISYFMTFKCNIFKLRAYPKIR